MANLCGRNHDVLTAIFGCGKCAKIKKKGAKRAQQIESSRPSNLGWNKDPSWSRGKKKQFPNGLPDEYYGE